MIVRLVVVDPHPRPGKSDLLVYQVPENSREAALLKDMLTAEGLEFTEILPDRLPSKAPKKQEDDLLDKEGRPTAAGLAFMEIFTPEKPK